MPIPQGHSLYSLHMNYIERLQHNIRLSYIVVFLTELIFVIPVWVGFARRIISFEQIALFTALSDSLVILLELPTGVLADLIGRRTTIMLGWLIRGMGTIFIGFAADWWFFLVGGIVCSLGQVLVSGADTALVYDTFKELKEEKRFGDYSAKAGLIARIALTIAILLGGYLYQINAGLPYWLQGAIQLAAALTVLQLVEPKIDSEKFDLSSYLKQTTIGFLELVKTPYIRKLSIFYALVGGITWSCVYYFNQPLANELGFSEIGQSWLFGAIYLASSVLCLLIVKNEERFPRKNIYLFFSLAMMMALLPGIWISKNNSWIFLLIITITASLRFSLLNKYVNQKFLSKYRATAVSSLNMLVNILTVVLIGLSGGIQDRYGTGVIFTMLGMLTIILVLPSALSLVKEDKEYHLLRVINEENI